MSQNVQYKSVKEKFVKGQAIILQGSSEKKLHFLNEGTIEVKRCGKEDISGADILDASHRIGIITSPSIFGAENLMTSTEQQNSFIAMSDCVVTKFIMNTDDLLSFFKGAPQIAMNILFTMKDLSLKNINNLKKFVHFLGEIEKIADNLDLFYYYTTGDESHEIVVKFKENGGVFPAKIEGKFLTSNFATLLDKVYGDPGYDPAAKFSGNKLDFYNKLLKAKPDAFIKMLSTDILIFSYMYQDLSDIINLLSSETQKIAEMVESKLSYLFYDPGSPFSRIISNIEKISMGGKVSENINQSIISLCRKIDHLNKQLTGIEHTDVFPKLDLLAKVKVRKEKKIEIDSKLKEKLNNSKNIILDFGGIQGEERSKISKDLNLIRKINFKDPTDKDSRKILKILQAHFFTIFEKVIINAIENTEDVPLPVKFFIYFGYIEQDLMTGEQLEFLNSSVVFYDNIQKLDYPIITLFDYLKLIYDQEEIPGLSAGGEEFLKMLRQGSRYAQVDDTPLGRVRFEIQNMAKESMRIISDNPRAYIPFLTEYSFRTMLNEALLTPKKLETFVRNINNIDYTLFFRELVWKAQGKSELIRKEVKPYLIICPNSGIRVQLWQEIVNNSRSSRARFLIPAIINDDLNKALINAFGHFRWRLNKLIAGANWMDPVEGGFIGSYYDYTQYYHKMHELSLEAKEKIKLFFYKVKGELSRFARDYELWVSYEKDGIAKLNKVVRAIFYRYLPFPRKIRSSLAKLPLYENIDTKYSNITNREYRSREAKFRKYADETGQLPQELQAFLDMLQG